MKCLYFNVPPVQSDTFWLVMVREIGGVECNEQTKNGLAEFCLSLAKTPFSPHFCPPSNLPSLVHFGFILKMHFW